MWPNKSDYELEDEMERDNVYAPIDEPFRPLPTTSDQHLTEDQKEYGRLQIELCRMALEQCKEQNVA